MGLFNSTIWVIFVTSHGWLRTNQNITLTQKNVYWKEKNLTTLDYLRLFRYAQKRRRQLNIWEKNGPYCPSPLLGTRKMDIRHREGLQIRFRFDVYSDNRVFYIDLKKFITLSGSPCSPHMCVYKVLQTYIPAYHTCTPNIYGFKLFLRNRNVFIHFTRL